MTRQELYELVWAEPMTKVAAKYKISDRGLAKLCAKAEIPVPERGYWARVQAGQTVTKTPLPAPTPDASQRVTIRTPALRLLHLLPNPPRIQETSAEIPRHEELAHEQQQRQQWHSDQERRALENERKKDAVLFDRLVGQSRDHRTASEIRELVNHVAASERANHQPESFRAWRDWALKQADRLDPLGSERLFDRTVSNTELWNYNKD